MKAVTSSEMLAIEKRALEELSVDTGHLMERAGKALADEFRRLPHAKRKAVVVCGKGNNGGDGFVAARLLREAGFGVIVFHAIPIDSFTPDTRRAFDRLPEDIATLPLDRKEDLKQRITEADGIIDALFGFGLAGGVRGLAVEVIELVNGAKTPVISADVPSGVVADSGKVEGACVKADVTVTFTCPKIGLILYPGAAFAGRISVVDIGIPRSFVEEAGGVNLSDPARLKALLPDYDPMQHKWSRGGVLVVAGSAGMEGAAILTARGAMRTGAGIVGIAAPSSIEPVISAGVVEAVKYLLPETSSHGISMEAVETLGAVMDRYRSVVIGPGLSRDKETAQVVRGLLVNIAKDIVLDADGLNAYAGEIERLTERQGELVITPHAGELGRLLGVETAEIENDGLGFARRAAELIRGTVVLKGARSVIAFENDLTVNLTGNPGMATAGTGDVLSGAIGSLMAQGLAPHEAAELAVYLHGLAGDIAAENLTQYSLMANDLSDFLPEAFKKLMET